MNRLIACMLGGGSTPNLWGECDNRSYHPDRSVSDLCCRLLDRHGATCHCRRRRSRPLASAAQVRPAHLISAQRIKIS
jgi:hypothetical protein